MHFYGITVIIICKSFKFMKSYTITLLIDCNTHSHTLSKTQNFFLNDIIIDENKEEGRSPSAEKKANFGDDRNFWPM